jgi:hypothetical protein
MCDSTEPIRRHRLAEINADPASRAVLESKYGLVWDAGELDRDFEVLGFMAPFVVVRRRASDGLHTLTTVASRTICGRNLPSFACSIVPENWASWWIRMRKGSSIRPRCQWKIG